MPVKRLVIIDNSKRLTDTQKFNILLDSYDILDPLIVKKTISQINEGLPAQVIDVNIAHTNRKATTADTSCPCAPGMDQLIQQSIMNKVDCQCQPSTRLPGDPPKPCTCVYDGKVAQPRTFICAAPILDEDRCRCNMTPEQLEQMEQRRKTEVESFYPDQVTTIEEPEEYKPVEYHPLDTKIDPEEIGACFRRGFRADNLALNGDTHLDMTGRDKLEAIRSAMGETENRSVINFSERKTPLEFLIGLGFSVDEASTALKNEHVKNRLTAAITEVSSRDTEIFFAFTYK